MRRTASHLYPSDILAAGYQRDGKEEKAACSPLCHVPKVNIQQDRTHGFASLLFSSYITSSCRPANWERELAPHFRQSDVLPDGGQRSRGFRISSRKSPHYRSSRRQSTKRKGTKQALVYPPLSFHPLVVNEAEENETSSRLSPTIVLPAGSQRSGRGRNKLPSIPHYRSTRW